MVEWQSRRAEGPPSPRPSVGAGINNVCGQVSRNPGEGRAPDLPAIGNAEPEGINSFAFFSPEVIGARYFHVERNFAVDFIKSMSFGLRSSGSENTRLLLLIPALGGLGLMGRRRRS